ncbi:hypothetical protein BLA24_30225 [Streptomyces cinnamoneus]|uniref:Uncharacterized protein n=1 Tax=Streptomyces cinnamoneus TaxID=53446 RepID=A0A2G1X955_STRCJ|nr:hypothetical protein [Streptomyces cinnamoneus]PHQ47792.1 hypothetical protein BLA24_30225 [Streptomyces cinnamoneus]PPT15417.1 hypothetical protein CYQ11_23315 [Streptomyces cinnamoneus]
MREHPVIRFTNELMMVSDLDQATAGAFVRSVFQEGIHEGEQRVIVEVHRRDRTIAELERELARLRGEPVD